MYLRNVAKLPENYLILGKVRAPRDRQTGKNNIPFLYSKTTYLEKITLSRNRKQNHSN